MEETKRGRGRPKLSEEEKAKRAQEKMDKALAEMEKLTPEEESTGEIRVKGFPEKTDVEKLARKVIGREVVRLAKSPGMDEKDRNWMIQALNAVKTGDLKDKKSHHQKELETLSDEELRMVYKNTKGIESKKTH